MFLQDIIDKYGLKGFFSLREYCFYGYKYVIATGSNLQRCCFEAFKEGFVVYIKLRLDEIEKRISNISSGNCKGER